MVGLATARRSGALGRAALAAVLLAGASAARAEHLDVLVTSDGEPVKDAVVYAEPLSPNGKPVPERGVVIDQIDKEYVPYVTAIPVGSSVDFPNHDQIRHHVYSFSEAKHFEIPLYAGTPAEPVVFDQSGTIALGCNIHDWMRAYIFVSDTPYFGVTPEDGRVRLELPPGDYAVGVWHPELKGSSEATTRQVSVSGEGSSLDFSIERKRVWRPRRAPSGGEDRYR